MSEDIIKDLDLAALKDYYRYVELISDPNSIFSNQFSVTLWPIHLLGLALICIGLPLYLWFSGHPTNMQPMDYGANPAPMKTHSTDTSSYMFQDDMFDEMYQRREELQKREESYMDRLYRIRKEAIYYLNILSDVVTHIMKKTKGLPLRNNPSKYLNSYDDVDEGHIVYETFSDRPSSKLAQTLQKDEFVN